MLWHRRKLHEGARAVSALRVIKEERRPVFTPKTLAAYLEISERTARQMIADRRIESFRVEGQRRILAEDVDAYVARTRTRRA